MLGDEMNQDRLKTQVVGGQEMVQIRIPADEAVGSEGLERAGGATDIAFARNTQNEKQLYGALSLEERGKGATVKLR